MHKPGPASKRLHAIHKSYDQAEVEPGGGGGGGVAVAVAATSDGSGAGLAWRCQK